MYDTLENEYTKGRILGLNTTGFKYKNPFCSWVALGGPALIQTHSAGCWDHKWLHFFVFRPTQHNCHTHSYTIRAGLLQHYDGKQKKVFLNVTSPKLISKCWFICFSAYKSRIPTMQELSRDFFFSLLCNFQANASCVKTLWMLWKISYIIKSRWRTV